ncbi:hypothetical protein [Acinetobacter baumannii]|uniref:hypothetical protein n=1 Tax=Acinetobacter baumannii TaxID=470 RepID=UPI001C474CB3|nr:hypothetical protein [Acinetobacter baumannii]MBV6609570.1 hypothetical protein [Acinetobacter baumannii]
MFYQKPAYDIWNREPTLAPQKDRYTPRLPPARLGTRLKADFDESLKGDSSKSDCSRLPKRAASAYTDRQLTSL